jgi:hypothetical protein
VTRRQQAARDCRFLSDKADWYDSDPKDCRLGPLVGRTFHLDGGKTVVEYRIEQCEWRIDGGPWTTDDLIEAWRKRGG